MATERLKFSLRIRHDSADLSALAKVLGLVPNAGWDKGARRRISGGESRSGLYDHSYRSFALIALDNTDLSDGLDECLPMLAPFASVMNEFVDSGGRATLSVGMFCDSWMAGGGVSLEALSELARLRLSLDLHIYTKPPSAPDEG